MTIFSEEKCILYKPTTKNIDIIIKIKVTTQKVCLLKLKKGLYISYFVIAYCLSNPLWHIHKFRIQGGRGGGCETRKQKIGLDSGESMQADHGGTRSDSKDT